MPNKKLGLWAILTAARLIARIVIVYSSKWPSVLSPVFVAWANNADEMVAILLAYSESVDGGPR
jgi:hypothetical protein